MLYVMSNTPVAINRTGVARMRVIVTRPWQSTAPGKKTNLRGSDTCYVKVMSILWMYCLRMRPVVIETPGKPPRVAQVKNIDFNKQYTLM